MDISPKIKIIAEVFYIQKDNKNIFIFQLTYNEIFLMVLLYLIIFTEVDGKLYIFQNDCSKMLDIVDKLSKPESTITDALNQ